MPRRSASAPGARPAPPRPGTGAKRVLDVAVSGIGLVVLSPLLAVIAWRVRREFGSPVLFRQSRPGLHGRTFTLYKFRTMSDRRGPDGELLPDEQRLTSFGRMLRSTSLDELPELWNVLRGDLSLVGPRPLLVEYLDRYTTEQARRHDVLPGLTGWAQVHGRNDMPWADKLALDVWYVDHHTFWLDLRILLRTVWVTVTRRGVSLAGHATTTRFDDEVAGDGRGTPPEASGDERGTGDGTGSPRHDAPRSGRERRP